MRLASVLVIALFTLPNPALSQAPEQSDGLYIALGDSIPAGIGSSLPRTRSYPAVLQQWMASATGGAVLLQNLSVSGDTAASFLSDGQLDALREEVERANSAGIPVLAVTVTLGGNEVLQQRDSAAEERGRALDAFGVSFPAALDAVRETVGAAVPIVVSTIYDPTGTPENVDFTDGWWIAQFNEVIRRAAGDRGLAVADIAAALGDAAASLTRYPADVHPTNEGHRAIAREFWATLAWDEDAPEITVLSSEEMSRPTPTLRFAVSEPVEERELAVTVDQGVAFPPVPAGRNEYVVLLDLGSALTATVEITAVDAAGNEATVTRTIAVSLPGR